MLTLVRFNWLAWRWMWIPSRLGAEWATCRKALPATLR